MHREKKRRPNVSEEQLAEFKAKCAKARGHMAREEFDQAVPLLLDLENKFLPARLYLADCYYYEYAGLERDWDKVVGLLESIVKESNSDLANDHLKAQAWYRLGFLSQQVRDPRLNQRARSYFRMAAKLGLLEAKYSLAQLYQFPVVGPPNYQEAIRLYDELIQANYNRALTSRACMHLEEQGSPASPIEGLKMLRKAAFKHKDDYAFYHLACLYARGRFVDQDLKAAKRLVAFFRRTLPRQAEQLSQTVAMAEAQQHISAQARRLNHQESQITRLAEEIDRVRPAEPPAKPKKQGGLGGMIAAAVLGAGGAGGIASTVSGLLASWGAIGGVILVVIAIGLYMWSRHTPASKAEPAAPPKPLAAQLEEERDKDKISRNVRFKATPWPVENVDPQNVPRPGYFPALDSLRTLVDAARAHTPAPGLGESVGGSSPNPQHYDRLLS